MKKYFFICMVNLFLFSCSDHQLKKAEAFNQQSKTGILVLGVTLNTPFPNPELTFRKYDPVTGVGSATEVFRAQPEGSNLRAQFGYVPDRGEQSYFVLNMPAGDWFLDCVHAGRSDGFSNYSLDTCFSTGTVAFTVYSGVANYIGEYIIESGLSSDLRIQKIKDNQPRAKEKFLEFKNITVPLEVQVPLALSYECVKKMVFINRYECDTSKINVKVGSASK